MATKEIAIEVIKRLPNDATMDDIMHALFVQIKFERGVNEIKEGSGVSHEGAKERFAQWLR